MQYAFLCARICRKFFVKIFNGTKRSKTLQNFSRLQNFARLCKSFKVFSLQDFAKLCKTLQKFQSFATFANYRKIMQRVAKFCKTFATTCESLQVFATVCTNLHEFATVCTSLQNFAFALQNHCQPSSKGQ